MAPDSRYLSCAEVAKLVRRALKVTFPRARFSVRSSTYSGGASIRVSWVDGPTERAVKALVSVYEGATFDGMQDLKSHHRLVVDEELAERHPGLKVGEQLRPGADFIFTARILSQPFLERVLEATLRYWGLPADTVGVEESEFGARLEARASDIQPGGYGMNLWQLVHRAAEDRTTVSREAAAE